MAHRDPLVDTRAAASGSPLSNEDDWPARASAAVVRTVDSVRDVTTGRALTASRYAVYATALALIAVIVAVLALILVVRLLVIVTNYVPTVDDGESWLAYLILGGIFLFAGWLLWRRKDRARSGPR